MSDDARLTRLTDRAEIQDLGVLYGFVMDEFDEDGVRATFCDDAELHSADGIFNARGIDEILSTYRERWAMLTTSNHFSHGHLVRFDDDDADRAYGLLSGHAEVARGGEVFDVALRYQDAYRRVEGRWKFASRTMSYMYYLPAAARAAHLGDRDSVWVYGDPRPADWPEVRFSGESSSFLGRFYS